MGKWVVAILLAAATIVFTFANSVCASADVLRDRQSVRAPAAHRQIKPVSRAVALALLFHAGYDGPRAWRK